MYTCMSAERSHSRRLWSDLVSDAAAGRRGAAAAAPRTSRVMVAVCQRMGPRALQITVRRALR